MKLSIVVPVYNGQDCILRCLKSIRNQTYKDFEIIVVNDGSTDNTKEIIEDIKKKFINQTFTVINQKNKGNSLARKTGIDIAKGEYVGFVDADDWIEPRYFESLIQLAEFNKADIVCSEITQDIGDKQKVQNHNTDETIISDSKAIKLLHQRKAVYQYMANKIIRRSLLEKITFPQNNMIGEDYTVVVQIICQAKTIVLSKERGYHYIISEESLSHRGYSESFANAIRVYPQLEEYLSNKFPESKIYITNFMLQNYMGAIMAMCKNKNYDNKNIAWIHKYVCLHWKEFVFKSNFKMYWKFGVSLFALDAKLFQKIYVLFNR